MTVPRPANDGSSNGSAHGGAFKEKPTMAETKVPTYQVRHVDGVMHLTVQPTKEPAVAPDTLRVQPPAEDRAE